MTLLTYDGSFDGLLTTIFSIYEERIADPKIGITGETTGILFSHQKCIETDFTKSDRVSKKLKQLISPKSYTQMFKAFLSEQEDIAEVIFRFVQYVIKSKGAAEYDLGNADVLQLQMLSRKVDKDKHRMKAFVRFQRTKDELYYSLVQPDYNVLPLVATHFKERYADQRWLIYDARRKYGIYYDLHKVHEVQLNFEIDLQNQQALTAIHDEGESLYQALWSQYYSSVNIKARRNIPLQVMHMPRRYWRYLTEKQPRL